MTLLRFGMQIPLFNNVVLSNIVIFLLTSIVANAAMSISIMLGCTSFGGCTPALGTSFSFVSFNVAISPSTDCYSTPSSLSKFWIHWCISWASLLLWTPTFSSYFQKLYYMWSWPIDVLNYGMCELHFFMILLPIFTLCGWWWMQWQSHCQWLNIQHSNLLPSSHFFNTSLFIFFLCMCSSVYASFSFAILYNFTIVLCIFIFLQTL